jgi:putative ABC transport system substrate-binding protein
MKVHAPVMTALLSLVVNPVDAQGKLPTIGFMSVGEPELTLNAFRDGLRELGYVEGRNVVLEVRFTDSRPQSLDSFAKELVARKVDVIVAGGSDVIHAAMRATSTIPIVMTQTSDAVGSGFLTNLARPGGNVTGITSFAGELGAKRLQLVKEILPTAKRIAVTFSSANPSHAPGLEVLQRAAPALGMEISAIEIRTAEDLDRAFAGFRQARPEAVLLLPDNMIVKERARVAKLAAAARLPVIYWRKEFVESGGLIAYGADNPAQYRRAAVYVDKILKGAKPGDLAVEQVSHYDVLVNLKAAREIGLRIPQSVLLRADKVIE